MVIDTADHSKALYCCDFGCVTKNCVAKLFIDVLWFSLHKLAFGDLS